MNWNDLLSERRQRTPSRPSDDRDQRTEFERDYGRIVFSTPLRRLQDKAQVFPLEPHDGVRTRLTHSLEVSTLARNIASAACRKLLADGELEPLQVHSVLDVASSAALLHDVGNPPFGHAGEQAIRDWLTARMSTKGLSEVFKIGQDGFGRIADDFLYFDGNAQMIRLVSRLQVLSDEYGLNLTFGTISAALKYVVSSHDLDSRWHSHSKPGYFDTERRLVEQVQSETGTGTARNPISYIVEAADDIVNAVVDLEDGLKKGVYTWDELKEDLSASPASARFAELTAAAEELVSKGGLKGKAQDDANGQAFRTQLMAFLVASVVKEFDSRYTSIMSGEFGDELVKACEHADVYSVCKKIVEQRVFCSSDVLRLEVMGREVIRDLMDLYWEGTEVSEQDCDSRKFAGKLNGLISVNYRHVFEAELEKPMPDVSMAAWRSYLRLRLVCDQVCGMTDTYAVREHRRLKNG